MKIIILEKPVRYALLKEPLPPPPDCPDPDLYCQKNIF